MTCLSQRRYRVRAFAPRRDAPTIAAPTLTLASLTACNNGKAASDTQITSDASDTRDTQTTGDATTATTAGPSADTDTDDTDTDDADTDSSSTGTNDPAICGNNILESGEQCDDGNELPDDGGEADCTLSPSAAYWTRTHDESGALDAGVGVATDELGDVYVVANVEDDLNQQDIWIRKYDPTGVSLWTQQYDGGVGSIDSVAAITSDSAGFMIALGRQSTGGGSSDFWLSRCDPQGQLLWSLTHDGADSGTDYAADVSVDSDGDIVVVGQTEANGQDDIWLTKYTGAGEELWVETFDGEAHEQDRARAVAVDPFNDIIIVGHETLVASFDTDVWIRKRAP